MTKRESGRIRKSTKRRIRIAEARLKEICETQEQKENIGKLEVASNTKTQSAKGEGEVERNAPLPPARPKQDINWGKKGTSAQVAHQAGKGNERSGKLDEERPVKQGQKGSREKTGKKE